MYQICLKEKIAKLAYIQNKKRRNYPPFSSHLEKLNLPFGCHLFDTHRSYTPAVG